MKKSALLMAVGILSFVFTANVDAQTKKIGMEKARTIATQKAAGKIEGEELEKENGKTIYSFDIRNSKGTITEVQVDAYTGAIVSVEEEDAAAEASEKRDEKNKGNEKMEGNEKQDKDDDESPAMKNARMTKLAKGAKITMEQARAIALARVPGTITEEDLENEKGVLQYSFDVKDANGKIFDIEIDAKSGKVLKAVEDKEDEDGDN